MTDAYRASAGAHAPGEILHATAVEIAGRAVLLTGRSGSGKSDLALRLIDRGARLISDDYTQFIRAGDLILARPPATIAGKMEVRGIGIIDLPYIEDIPVALHVTLDEVVERMPLPMQPVSIAGVDVPAIAATAFHASSAIKIELMLSGIKGSANG